MADYKVTDTQLSSIANAIRTKGGTSASLAFPSGFVSAVENIPTGGVLISKTISQNGSYRATDDNADGYSDVIVNVSGGSSHVLISKTISQNGTYNPSDDDADAYSQVIVSVSGGGGGNDDAIMTGDVSEWTNNSLLKLRSYALYSDSVITSVTLPLCSIVGRYAFLSCVNLNTISLPECLSISNYVFSGCNNLKDVNLQKCEFIGVSAFADCKSLSYISMPECITLGANAFYSCTSLETAYIPKCETIDGNAFEGCTKLSELYLPVCKSLKNQYQFRNCTILEKLVLLSESVCQIFRSNALQNTPIANSSYLGYFGSIYVPASLVDAYKSASNWSYYSDRITAYVEE